VLRAKAAQAEALRFSSHAQQRIESGGVRLDGEAMARLERAVDAADQKGAKDALVLMDDLALLVSISNRTVITAVDQTRRKNGVFTNIDSVVMA
jgi:flagellar operon protein